MGFVVAKKGVRTSKAQINISRLAKTITFSAGFFRTHDINLNKITYVRLAFDTNVKEIAVEFAEVDENNDEYLKLTLTQSKTSASCSANPILTPFKVNIEEISGIYKDGAISGPVQINGFSDHGFILKINNRAIV